jgi:acetyl-CoA carboxylase biotin carboxyl carrier protein
MTEGEREQQRLSPDDEFGLSAVREVLRLIQETDVTEIQIKRGDAELHIKRGGLTPTAAPLMVTPSLAAALQPTLASPLPPIAPFQQPSHPAAGVSQANTAAERNSSGRTAAEPEPAPAPNGQPITAPMVGTFYAAPSPKDQPYIQEGDTIHPGDRVGIIETMKMMNEIEAEIGGRITRILVQNGQPVEYGQALMLVEPL